MINPGRLRHRVTLQSPSQVNDSYGQPIPTWNTYATVWASIEPLSGREIISAQQAQSEASLRVRLRYIEGVTPMHRIGYGDRTLAILSVVDPREMHAELELLCQEAGN